uniref:Uncharacterized protein n=1 Tax=Medicago truncatula TaxID=3880 RepID=I3SPC6_MEDTR|nr:unknown [Medicago truncatula]
MMNIPAHHVQVQLLIESHQTCIHLDNELHLQHHEHPQTPQKHNPVVLEESSIQCQR